MVVSCPPCWVLLLVKAEASLPTSAFCIHDHECIHYFHSQETKFSSLMSEWRSLWVSRHVPKPTAGPASR